MRLWVGILLLLVQKVGMWGWQIESDSLALSTSRLADGVPSVFLSPVKRGSAFFISHFHQIQSAASAHANNTAIAAFHQASSISLGNDTTMQTAVLHLSVPRIIKPWTVKIKLVPRGLDNNRTHNRRHPVIDRLV